MKKKPWKKKEIIWKTKKTHKLNSHFINFIKKNERKIAKEKPKQDKDKKRNPETEKNS